MKKTEMERIGVAIESILTVLMKLGFKVYVAYGYNDIKQTAFHLKLKSCTTKRLTYLVNFLGAFNFTGQMNKSASEWILSPYNYGDFEIYLSLEVRNRDVLTIREVELFAEALVLIQQT